MLFDEPVKGAALVIVGGAVVAVTFTTNEVLAIFLDLNCIGKS